MRIAPTGINASKSVRVHWRPMFRPLVSFPNNLVEESKLVKFHAFLLFWPETIVTEPIQNTTHGTGART